MLDLCSCTRAFFPWSAQTSRCGGFSCCRAQTLGAWASVVATHGLRHCGAWAMCDPPGPGIEHVFPALEGGFLNTGPPAKSLGFAFVGLFFLLFLLFSSLVVWWPSLVSCLGCFLFCVCVSIVVLGFAVPMRFWYNGLYVCKFILSCWSRPCLVAIL